MERCLTADHYVARSEYEEELKGFDGDIEFFAGITAENLLDEFCSSMLPLLIFKRCKTEVTYVGIKDKKRRFNE